MNVSVWFSCSLVLFFKYDEIAGQAPVHFSYGGKATYGDISKLFALLIGPLLFIIFYREKMGNG